VSVGILFIKIFEGCYAFFSFFFVVQVNGASLLNALFGEEFAPVASFVEGAGIGDGSPVEPPTSDLRHERGTRVTLSRFNATARVDYPAEVFFFHLGVLPKRNSVDWSI
jgi:hypothetical protein